MPYGEENTWVVETVPILQTKQLLEKLWCDFIIHYFIHIIMLIFLKQFTRDGDHIVFLHIRFILLSFSSSFVSMTMCKRDNIIIFDNLCC